jgi:hypothetical protein
MADIPPLTAADYDVWRLATPQQLLTLIGRLGVGGSELARWLRVPKSLISMWTRGSRAIPQARVPALRTYAQRALEQAYELGDKAAQLAPTRELAETLRQEVPLLWQRWRLEVLADAGTLRRGFEADYQALGQVVRKAVLTAKDVESLELIAGTLVQKAKLLLALQPETPDPDAEWAQRLTAAREQAQVEAARQREGGQEQP